MSRCRSLPPDRQRPAFEAPKESKFALTAIARTVVPALGRLTVTTGTVSSIAPGGVVAPHHTALIDPGVVLSALRGLGAEPLVLAAAGLWRVPVLGRFLTREESPRTVGGGSPHPNSAIDSGCCGGERAALPSSRSLRPSGADSGHAPLPGGTWIGDPSPTRASTLPSEVIRRSQHIPGVPSISPGTAPSIS